MKVESRSVKYCGIEDLKQASYSDGSFFFHIHFFSDIGFSALNRSFAKVYTNKEQKYIKEKKTNKKQIRSCKMFPLHREKQHVKTLFKNIFLVNEFCLSLIGKILKKTFAKLLENTVASFL